MADAYNINIETKAQLDEIHKLLEELRAISAEMSVIWAFRPTRCRA